MNRIWICCLIFTLSLGSAAWSQEKKAGGGTEKAIVGLEQQIRRAVIKGDTSILERYLADDYVGIGPNGDAADKSKTIQELKDGTVKYSAIDVTEENVRMYGDTGIYNGRGDVKLTVNGQPQTADVRVTIVWLKQNGQWKRVSFQATRVQPARTGS
jgi:ketosteroid isomerase-like protein